MKSNDQFYEEERLKRNDFMKPFVVGSMHGIDFVRYVSSDEYNDMLENKKGDVFEINKVLYEQNQQLQKKLDEITIRVKDHKYKPYEGLLRQHLLEENQDIILKIIEREGVE